MFTIFYFAGERDPREIAQALSREGHARWAPGGELIVTEAGDISSTGGSRDERSKSLDERKGFRFIFQTHPARAIHALSNRPVDLLIIDGRVTGDGGEKQMGKPDRVVKIVSSLLSSSVFPSKGVRKGKILVVLRRDEHLGENAFRIGKFKVGGVLIDPFEESGLIKAIVPYLTEGGGSKVALCLAGGGVEGLIYELGVLMALDRIMVNKNVVDFDIFCGISAGAIISAFLANGVSPEEVARGMQEGTGKIDKISRFAIFWPNFRELPSRVLESVKKMLQFREKVEIEALLWGILPGGVMNGENLKWYLEKQLTKEGLTNNFEQVKKELYIGVTDQDNSSHVVFGEMGLRDVPISHAVTASAALVPFYPPQKVRNRYYIDGAFTKTTNISVAVKHGAGLVIVVNPWVPLRSSHPGFINSYGGAFNTLQAIKTLVSARFYQDYENADELFPTTFIHLFVPEGEELGEMKGTLMKFFYRPRLIDIAYRRTIQTVRERYDIMERDFKRFGIKLVEPEEFDEDANIPFAGMDRSGERKIVDFSLLRRAGGMKL